LKKIIGLIVLIIAIMGISITVLKIRDYNSLVSKNTRYLEQILSEDITSGKDSVSGNVKDLIILDYDKMYVFGPYKSVEEMEKQIGFEYSGLKQGLNEGIMNILFVKGNSAVAHLFGYPSNIGYGIRISGGEHTKVQIDKMTYTMEEREVGNPHGTPKTYMNYEFME